MDWAGDAGSVIEEKIDSQAAHLAPLAVGLEVMEQESSAHSTQPRPADPIQRGRTASLRSTRWYQTGRRESI